MRFLASFDDICKKIKEAFPKGKALPRYDQGFKDALDSVVLAARAHRISAFVLHDMINTAMDAFANNALSTNNAPAHDILADEVAFDIARTLGGTDLHIKTSATGVLFFQAVQEKLLTGLAFNTSEVAASFGLVMRSGVDFARQEINQSKLDAFLYLSLLEFAVRDFDYTVLVHSKPVVFTQYEPFNTTVNTQRSKGDTKQWVEATFDRLHAAGDSTVNRMWLARCVQADESPQTHEWGIASSLVGVAMPDEMFDHFAEEAALRAQIVASACMAKMAMRRLMRRALR